MKTPSHARSNQPSKDQRDLNAPAPKAALTPESMPKLPIEVNIPAKTTSQGQPGLQFGRSKPHQPTVHYEERKAQIDVTGLVHNIIRSNLTIWRLDESRYYEYVVGSLHKHDIIDKNALIQFEKYRNSGATRDVNIMASIYPICFEPRYAYRFELFKADIKALEEEELLEHIESIIDVYRDAINSHKEFMSQPDVPLPELPETAPVLWEDAPKREKPIEFINRVYGDYIRQGLMTQGDLRHLDYKLYRAFHNWCDRKEIDPKTIVPPGRRRTEKILDEFGDLTFENSLGLVFKTAHAQDTVPSELVRRGEAFFSLLRRRKINMKQSPS